MHSSGDLYPRLVESQAFSSFGRWLQLSPFFFFFFATTSLIFVDQSLPETALSPYYGHSLVFICRSLSSSASPSYGYAEGWLRGRWVECFLVIIFGC